MSQVGMGVVGKWGMYPHSPGSTKAKVNVDKKKTIECTAPMLCQPLLDQQNRLSFKEDPDIQTENTFIRVFRLKTRL